MPSYRYCWNTILVRLSYILLIIYPNFSLNFLIFEGTLTTITMETNIGE